MKRNFLRFSGLLVAVLMTAMSTVMVSCEDDNTTTNTTVVDNGIEVTITSNITTNTTWSSDSVYILAGRIAVEAGAKLTIEAGTVIKGQVGSGANATALVVARGAQIDAQGTATAPIIFTSVSDEITPADIAAGNFATNMEPTYNGLWGGLIILGNAPIEAKTAEAQIEGIPTSDANGLYGGTAAADNSGILKYISIRHGGTNIGAGNEINGLTLGAVGSGTTIENIEIVSNQDDGVEFFGGTVNITNLLSWNVGDDGIDTDQGWMGTISNFLVVTPADNCFELDGPENSNTTTGHTLQNGTVIAAAGAGHLVDIDKNSEVALKDVFYATVHDGLTMDKDTAALVSFDGVVVNVADSLVAAMIPAGTARMAYDAGKITIAATGAGATVSEFAWTWAYKFGALDAIK